MAQRGMKFGIFLAPFHRLGENPTLAMARDLELIEWLDWLGYDEAPGTEDDKRCEVFHTRLPII